MKHLKPFAVATLIIFGLIWTIFVVSYLSTTDLQYFSILHPESYLTSDTFFAFNILIAMFGGYYLIYKAIRRITRKRPVPTLPLPDQHRLRPTESIESRLFSMFLTIISLGLGSYPLLFIIAFLLPIYWK